MLVGQIIYFPCAKGKQQYLYSERSVVMNFMDEMLTQYMVHGLLRMNWNKPAEETFRKTFSNAHNLVLLNQKSLSHGLHCKLIRF